MSKTDKVFTGSIEVADVRGSLLTGVTLTGVRLFDADSTLVAWLPRADLAYNPFDFAAGRVETAAGSGVVTRALLPRLVPSASYVVTDLNQPMLDQAATRQPADSRISWRKADAQALPFEDAVFGLVCCQFGVMFFPDRQSGYREAKRVLKPGGCFMFNVWDRIEENVFANDVTNALAEVFPNDPPRFLARTPHGYHDTALIRSDLEQAGFSRVAIETRAEQSRASSEMRRSWRQQPITPHPRSQTGTEAARLLPKSRPM